MAEKTINTRIVLRNDELSNWNDSKKVLLKGEVALAKREDGLYEMRVGDDEHYWSQLSGTGIGRTKFYEKSSLEDLEALSNVPNGSIGIVTETLATGLSSKTAYTYNETDKRWEALDGNYSAENVYFKDNIGLAGSYTQVGNVTKSGATGTLSCSGWSVKQVFEEIFDKTIQPTHNSYASAKVTLTNAGSKEIGSKITPSYTTTFTQGKYNTPWNNSTVNDGTTEKSWSITDGTTTKTTSTGSFDKFTVTSSTNYKLNGSMEYNDGNIAKNNKGADSNPPLQHMGDEITLANSSAITGYYPYYTAIYANKKFDDPSAITSADIIADTTQDSGITTKNSFTKGATKPSSESSFTSRTMQQWFWVVKKGLINGIAVKQQSPEAPHTVIKYENSIKLPLANGQGDIDYDVWYVSNDGSMTNGFKVTVS